MAVDPIINTCTETLEGYAQRGFLQGLGVISSTGKQAKYNLPWHFNKVFELHVNLNPVKIHMPVVLPNVLLRSAMDKDFRTYIQELSDSNLPAHRRFTPDELSVSNRKGNLSLTLKLASTTDSDQVVTQLGRFISLVHEVYKIFLKNGHYDQYVADQFGIDSDSFW